MCDPTATLALSHEILLQDTSQSQDEPATSSGSIYFDTSTPSDALLTFSPPLNPTQEEVTLSADIVLLDHASMDTFNPKSQYRAEIWGLVRNAIVLGLEARQPADGRRLLEQAQVAFRDHLETINRLRYLLGLVLGTVALAIIATAVLWFTSSVGLHLGISPELLIGLFAFAGMGTLASVLSRLSSLDLGQQRSQLILFISGASRPLVAIILAIVVYLILRLQIVNIQVGTGAAATSNPEGVYLIAAFLSGFSERFAQDIIASVPFGRDKKSPGPSSSSSTP